MRRRAFCVGQAKAGTASLAGLLSANYRAAHEPERAETLALILREARGQLSAPDVRTYRCTPSNGHDFADCSNYDQRLPSWHEYGRRRAEPQQFSVK